MLELERKDGYFNISGLRYDDDEAMRIADYIVNVLQDEHMHEHGHDEVKAKYNNENPF